MPKINPIRLYHKLKKAGHEIKSCTGEHVKHLVILDENDVEIQNRPDIAAIVSGLSTQEEGVPNELRDKKFEDLTAKQKDKLLKLLLERSGIVIDGVIQ